jgi:ribosome-associated translation inhibitor RaiA
LLFTISGKHIEITEAIKKHAEEKTSKLPKMERSRLVFRTSLQ